MRTIDDIIDDIVSCADEMDGGKMDARAFAQELADTVRVEMTRSTIVMTRSTIVDCPECYRVCGWCSWYVYSARLLGCGAVKGNGRPRKKKCESAQVLKGTTCPLCCGALKVKATTTYEALP